MAKAKTYEQAKATQEKAVRFVAEVLEDDDKADEIESLSVAEYANRKNFRITNPILKRSNKMASTPITKSELQALVDDAGERITNMLDPALTREELVQQVQELDELINGTEDDENDDEEDEDPA